ncbi:cytochrome c biogenesis CcdA family protein [Actinoplanes regularis]|uniref:Cytochrome c-type biogenesis protein n=1 Tax=Actinoplanes regularis TaxID=52697 RepID=A0A239C986_9ACTN|nr:cytochrome c biogenesis protein CcdA [Actinoplanes regularis]GIE89512.1 cytochrome C biogenesis protein [Actinoplanes regularis]GLW32182.1 cytochrome C biogenesis protein [Actinoplanes regularis]SNS16795.1 cytochrome c-type biogenesis protein [Actinoplanes regularis]
MGDAFKEMATSGPLALAIGAALIAGLVSILSPCVLPLVPGYLSYVTGLAGSDLEAAIGTTRPASTGEGGGVATATKSRTVALKSRVLAGSLLFVLGFSVVFTLMITLVTGFVSTLMINRDTLNLVLGVLIILLGLVYLGWIPGLQREARISKLPSAGLLGAPVFGAIFALSWIPCTGPTLGAVIGLATTTGSTDRAVILALAFSLGLGVPFILFGLFFRKLIGVFKTIRRNSRWVTRIGGLLLLAVGITLVSGQWLYFLAWLQSTLDLGGEPLL